MRKLIRHWCRCDIDRAEHLQRSIKVWAAYLGLIFLGGVIFCAPLYVWFDRAATDMRGQYQVETQRMQDINQGLLAIIQERLPPIVAQAANAASTAQVAAESAKGAVTGARRATKQASGAATTAKEAASAARGAADDLSEALAPPPAAPAPSNGFPEWIGGS